jgi:polar amino acid transport system substrate-binding protein
MLSESHHTTPAVHRSRIQRSAAVITNPGVKLAAGLAVALFSITCGTPSGGGASTDARQDVQLVVPGKLTVCTNLPFEPFEFQQDGKIVGFDIDIVELAARKLGVPQDIINIDFGVIKSGAALNSGRCDLAVAGMTITDERRKNLDFSVPYYDASQALMTKKGSGVTSLDDVKARRLKIGAMAATTGLEYVRSRGFDPVQFDGPPRQLLALQTGQIDVIVQDLPVVLSWIKKPEIAAKLEMVTSLHTGEEYGVGFKKGNAALLKVVDEEINAARKDGRYDAMYKKWFGTDPPATP